MSDKRRWTLSFILGILVGAAAMGVSSHYYFCHWKNQNWQANHDSRRREFLNELNSKLRLTPDQHQKVVEILDARHKKMDEFRGTARAQFKQMRGEVQSQVRSLLTEEQKPAFEKIVDERNKKWEMRETNWNGK